MFLLPVISIFLIFILYQGQNRWKFGPISFTISVYVAMAICSIILYAFFGFDELFDVRLEPVSYLSLCLCIVFYGLASFTDKQNRVLIIDNIVMLRLLEVFQLLSSIVALSFFLPFVLSAMSGSIFENRLGVANIIEELGHHAFLNTFCSLVGNLFPISILLAFINLATIGRGGSRSRAHALLAGSSVYVAYILTYVGRDGFVYWVFTFVFFYLLFKEFLPQPELRSIKTTALAVTLPSLISFVLITISRAFDYAPSGPGTAAPGLSSVFEYAGGQIFYFNDHYLTDAPPLLGLMNFGQFIEFGLKLSGASYEALDRIEWFKQFTDVGVLPWTFSTFIGAFLHDFGKTGTLIAIIIFSGLTRVSLAKHAKTGVMSLSRLLIVFLLVQVVLWGVFYYRQYSAALYQVTVVLISLAFRLSRSRDKILIIQKLQESLPMKPVLHKPTGDA